MRSKDYLDWLLEGLLMLVFCGVIAGLPYSGLNYGDTVVTLRAVAAVWITFGFVRCIKNWRGRR